VYSLTRGVGPVHNHAPWRVVDGDERAARAVDSSRDGPTSAKTATRSRAAAPVSGVTCAYWLLNAGSSTLKWTLLDGRDRSTLEAGSEEWAAPEPERRVEQIPRSARQGLPLRRGRAPRGSRWHPDSPAPPSSTSRRVRILEALAALDQLHMRPALAGIDAVRAEFPGATQVAAFDTSFHATLPEAAAGYALPVEWSERWGLRRFGFHGLSVQYSLEQAKRLLGRTPAKLIVCHLGSGCSITAVAGGRSIDTTMGFTPLDGVMMATRSGSVDPGLLLYLQARCGIGLDELRETLANRSGLLRRVRRFRRSAARSGFRLAACATGLRSIHLDAPARGGLDGRSARRRRRPGVHRRHW